MKLPNQCLRIRQMASYKPTEGMVEEAQRGLEWRREFGRGGTEVGIARARDIVNGKNLSDDTVKRMFSFFSRHEVDKQAEGFSPGEEGYPSNGRIAWALWGGDAGFSWSKDKVAGMDNDRAAPDELKVGDFVSWDSSGGRARGRIEHIMREGVLGVPDSDFSIEATEEDPAALIRIYRDGEETETLVGHRFSTLTKISEIRAYDEERPYPNEHAARIADPDRFDDFRRDTDAGGSGVDYIYGLLADGGSELQSIRFDKDKFSAAEARAWLSENDFNAIKFEEATEERTVEEAPEVAIEEPVEATEALEATPVAEEQDRKAAPEVVHRAMDMEAQIVDEEKRTAHIAVSSELPVERSFGKEVLMHEDGAIDMEFIASGRAPLLLDHDMERQIGVIESVSLSDDRRLRAKVRFGRSALAQEVFQDVVDGIRSNISVGYRVNEMSRDDKQRDVYRVRSWKPLEVSVVSIPADPSVGVGRSAAAPEPSPTVEPSIRKEDTMSEEVNLDAVRAEAAKEAARNASDIIALGARHNKRDMAEKAIAEGKDISQFRGELLDVLGTETPLENTDIGLSRKERKEFRLVRAIAALANPNDRRLREAAAFEFEASEAAAQRYGRSAQGVMIPTDVLGTWKRDLNTSDDNELVATDLLAGEFVDALRNASSVMAAGARMLTGLSGNVSIPTKATASAGGWISTEGGASSESEPTFGNISMTPKTVGAFTDMTRQMIIQSSLDIEALVRDDLTQALAIAIDKGGLEGSGSSGQPTGILNTAGVNTVTAFAAAVPTFAEMVSLETAVAADNALLGNLAYITDAATAGGLKTKAKDAGSGLFVLESGEANGYPVIVSQQATAGNVYFGNFSDLLIGMFGGLDITVDPYSSSNTGTVRVVALQSVDVGVRHAVSFAYGNDGA
jgi:HK97 family phage major capsid protein/HK97 family phage prohead protease